MRDGRLPERNRLDGKRGPFVQVGEVGVAGATLTTGGTRRAGGPLRPASFCLISET
jgi:hypothetical protein